MLNVNYFKQQSKLQSLKTIELRLIPALAFVTDLDGRIDTTVEQIKKLQLFSDRSIQDALGGLVAKEWIRLDHFFFYAITAKIPGNPHTVAIEKLFQNDCFKGIT